MLDPRTHLDRRGWISGIALALAIFLLAPAAAHAQEDAAGTAEEAAADPVGAVVDLLDQALAATDPQAVIDLLEGPEGASEEGTGIIPLLESATGRSASAFAGGMEVETDDPLVEALARAVAVDEALKAALAGGDADPAAVLQEQMAALQELRALLSDA